jgi:cellulose synthase/poly-beta-1,6-N-acetylglucosamine synthase-like glycosyltransferase
VEHEDLPSVTVQVPVYNERHVVERVIDAVASLSYPPERLAIQVLDDSDDDTTSLAQARAAFHRERGVNIEVMRRPDRTGYKAGALAWGLDRATGGYIAVFDADFQPRADFLLKTVPHFLSDPQLGMVQARWSFLNSGYSALTRAQTLALDGHFVVEKTARSQSCLLMSFNGAGGVWRRTCIEDCGGWSASTLCEDLDLSYRAQLAGWTCLYDPNVAVPAELPPQVAAFRRQQARWAQGSIQCLRKLTSPLLRADHLTWRQKAMALVHLSSYASHPLMVALLLVSLPLLLVPASAQLPLGALGLVYLGPPLLYALAQKHLHRDWIRRLRAFPLLAMLGVGIAWCNTKAVWRGLTRWGGRFWRTPKFRLEGHKGDWLSSAYRLRGDGSPVGEVALAAYALVTAAAATFTRQYGVLPFVLLYAAGFGTAAGLEIAQAWDRRCPADAHARSGRSCGAADLRGE